MAKAPVGDEQRREDPSVNELQELVADLTGKDAALFVPSGTMCNAIAFIVHCRRGDAVILDRTPIRTSPKGAVRAVLAGAVMVRPMSGERGIFTADQARAEITAGDTHTSRTAMISVENTTNSGGGKVWPLERLAELRALADEHGMMLHMDGARLMNAVVASGNSAEDVRVLRRFGLDRSLEGTRRSGRRRAGGTSEFIEEARLWKHRFGGAMRQAGVIAAAGIYAFQHNVDRMADDHANAKLLEDGLAQIPGVRVVRKPVETNIVLFNVSETGKTAAEVATVGRAARRADEPVHRQQPIRAVTHLDVSREDCERAVEAMQAVASGAR